MSYVTQNRRQNPGGLAAAIAVNGAIIAAVMLSPMVVNSVKEPGRTTTFTVPEKQPPPPPDKIVQPKTEARPLDPIFVPPTPFDYKTKEDPPFTTNDPPENTGGAMDGGGKGDAIDVVPKVDPVPIALFRPATRDPRFAKEFQPDYPSGLIQREIEGSATIRVLIGPDGRVREANVVRASHPDFGKAAVRQALKAWRFKPATRGDAVVEDWQTISVTFVIN